MRPLQECPTADDGSAQDAQIDPIHDPTQPNVCEDQCNVLPTDQHDGKRSFRAFALDRVQLLVFKQRGSEAAQFCVVLDD